MNTHLFRSRGQEMNVPFPTRLSKINRYAWILCLAACLALTASRPAVAQIFHDELQLPDRALSKRVTRRLKLEPGSTATLFDEDGPGAILHWWITYTQVGRELDRAHQLRLKMYYDGAEQPAVNVTLAQFFSVLLGNDPYMVDNAAFKILPKNAFNFYLPIPFESLRIELTNKGQVPVNIWFMADWHRYPEIDDLTPLRLKVIHQKAFPADSAGSFLMADLKGQGFIAGMTLATRVLDDTDWWYHNGGDLVLLDGMTQPRAMRGIGGEDVFGMSFGTYPVQTRWVGQAYRNYDPDQTTPEEASEPYEVIMYRIFGPAPIWFTSSAVLRFGTKANDLESIVYAYVAPSQMVQAMTPSTWLLAGPFQTKTLEDFNESKWAEKPVETWPEEYTADFGQYISNLKGLPHTPTTFSIPVHAQSEHGWVDFARYFRGRRRANKGTQPVDVSAYAVGTLQIDEAGKYTINIGYDDRLRLWINDKKVYTGRHANGFEVAHLTRRLSAGEVTFRIKLSNKNNFQWRLWAFSFSIEEQ